MAAEHWMKRMNAFVSTLREAAGFDGMFGHYRAEGRLPSSPSLSQPA
jgi:hypothetical protein